MTGTGSRDRRRESERTPQIVDSSAAFSLLGNETRLAILKAIWEEQVPLAPNNTVPFSRIFDRVNIADRGNFSYHLEQLEGKFITQHTDRGGYELLIPGLKLVRIIVAGTGIEDALVEPTAIDVPCPLCDALTEIFYRDGVVFLRCTDCAGMAPGKADIDSVLNAVYFEPAGLHGRDAEELFAASLSAATQQARSLFDRICPVCSGVVEGRLECCPDHDPTGGCDHCGLQFGVVGRYQCQTCKFFGGGNLKRIALSHPAMVSFYDDHGISTRVPGDDFESAKRFHRLIYDFDVERRSTDPLRMAVQTTVDGDEITLTFDETAHVVAISR